ncbi:hypothetical protein V2J09_001424 [Rumex salicifolius]
MLDVAHRSPFPLKRSYRWGPRKGLCAKGRARSSGFRASATGTARECAARRASPTATARACAIDASVGSRANQPSL